jgi:CheY-like chemotaxis protein
MVGGEASASPSQREGTLSADATLVFVVADDPVLRRAVGRSLWRATGLHAISMRGGHAAHALVRAARPAAVLLDVSTPSRSGSGLALADAIKADLATAAIPVIALGGPGVAGEERARAAGCDAFVAHPCAPADVMQVVCHHIRVAPVPLGATA